MCGGGPSGPSEEDKQKSEQRHQDNLALQKEQMEEQKRQFELSRQDNQVRYVEQKKKAEAAPPPPPEKTAAVASPTFEFKRKGSGRKAFRTDNKRTTNTPTQSSAHSAKSLYIPR